MNEPSHSITLIKRLQPEYRESDNFDFSKIAIETGVTESISDEHEFQKLQEQVAALTYNQVLKPLVVARVKSRGVINNLVLLRGYREWLMRKWAPMPVKLSAWIFTVADEIELQSLNIEEINSCPVSFPAPEEPTQQESPAKLSKKEIARQKVSAVMAARNEAA